MYYYTEYNSPVGLLTVASDGQHIIGLWLEGQKYFGGKIASQLTKETSLPIFNSVTDWLDRYFNGKKPSPNELPLALNGSKFYKSVWQALLDIPYGETTTYSEIAKKAGLTSQAVRAVGGAIGKNPISIIIPCHRVISKNGSLTGYAGGLERKLALLEHEKA